MDHGAGGGDQLLVTAVDEQQLDAERVDARLVELESCLDAVDDVGVDVEHQARGAIVVEAQEGTCVDHHAVDGGADAPKGVGVDVAPDDSCDIFRIGQRRVVGDLEDERRSCRRRFGWCRWRQRCCSRRVGRVGRWGFGRFWRFGWFGWQELERVTGQPGEQIAQLDGAVGIDGETLLDQFEPRLARRLGRQYRGRSYRSCRHGFG